jgi:cell division protein FtsQ
MEVMGGDIGRNIFFIPLAERQSQLEQIPWVESASVMRFVPNHLQVDIHERTPIAFARVGSKIQLVDKAGTLMELPSPGKKKFSFPVILGMNTGEPLSTRTPRMRIYNDLVSQLDASGAHYSQELSEVDLTDPDDVKVLANDPTGAVLVHLGSSNYLDRYKIYKAHLQEWRQQFDKLESVDLRYDRQIIVNPDLRGSAKQLPLSARLTHAALSAGVKPAALVTHDRTPSNASSASAPAKSVVKPPVHKNAANKKKAAQKKLASKKSQVSGRPVAAKAATGTPATKKANVTPKPSAGKTNKQASEITKNQESQ